MTDLAQIYLLARLQLVHERAAMIYAEIVIELIRQRSKRHA